MLYNKLKISEILFDDLYVQYYEYHYKFILAPVL